MEPPKGTKQSNSHRRSSAYMGLLLAAPMGRRSALLRAWFSGRLNLGCAWCLHQQPHAAAVLALQANERIPDAKGFPNAQVNTHFSGGGGFALHGPEHLLAQRNSKTLCCAAQGNMART